MVRSKRQHRARRKAKANRLARWQGVPMCQRPEPLGGGSWDWLMGRAR